MTPLSGTVRCERLPAWDPTDLAGALLPGPLALLDGLTWQGRRCALLTWAPGPVLDSVEAATGAVAHVPPDAPTEAPPLLFAAVGTLDWDGAVRFAVPQGAALFDPEAGCLWTRGELPAMQPATGDGAGGVRNGGGVPGAPPQPLTPATPLWDRSGFTAAAREAISRMEQGEIEKVILSVPFAAPCADSPLAVYRRLTVDGPPGLRFLLLEQSGGALLGVSPEPLVLLADRRAELHLLAGTRTAGAAMEQDLLSHPKDRVEHTVAVEQGRRDLLSVCEPDSVQVAAFMTTEQHGNLVHLASHLVGTLRPEATGADLVRACFPAGTVAGVPRRPAVALINQLETHPRQWYAGAVGALLPGGDLQLWLTIRSLALEGGVGIVRCGAGMVSTSDPASEWQECLNKARRPLAALGAEVMTDA